MSKYTIALSAGAGPSVVYIRTAEDWPLAAVPKDEAARRILTQPALLEALETLVAIYGDMQDGDGETPAEITKARAALSQARGEG